MDVSGLLFCSWENPEKVNSSKPNEIDLFFMKNDLIKQIAITTLGT